jgi:RNA polymerase sigma-70 factor (ECF subfamily)
MAGPVFGRKSASARERRARVVPLDRDRALVAAARRDPRAFEPLYRKYVAQVYSYAFYELGDRHAAEDATERAFLAALTGLPRFEERAGPTAHPEASTFRVWLFRIARNVVANERRATRRRREAPLEAAATTADPLDVEATAVGGERAAEAWRAIGRLPADRRRAIVLRFVHDMSTAEIAAVLDRTEGAVRVLLHRALRAGARDLGDRAP